MSNYRKIRCVVIALLPLLAILTYIAVNFSQGDLSFTPMGSINIQDTASGVKFICEPDSWADRLITPLVGSEPVGGLYGALGRFCVFLSDNAGIPVSLPVVLAVCYYALEMVLLLMSFVFDLLTFVPRKCLEVFR